jgi:hypothetical protein
MGLITDAAARAMRGAFIGRGVTREVCEHATDPTKVVKMIHKKHTPIPMANFIEWIIWCSVRETPLHEIFGECFDISESGDFLIMERLDDISKADWADVPRFPDWLNDRKQSAFGKNANGIKCRDYALLTLSELVVRTTFPVPFQLDAMARRVKGEPGY